MSCAKTRIWNFSSFLLDGIGFGKDAFLLGELVDRPATFADLVGHSVVAREFVTYRDGEFVSRSPILARFVLTNLETSGSVNIAFLIFSGRRQLDGHRIEKLII